MADQRKPSAILRAIGERIADERRWTTDHYARNALGESTHSRANDATCWCWEGALLVVSDPSEDWTVRCRVRDFMQRSIERPDIGAFNDTHTHAEVLAANARAIELAESEGQ